MKLFRGTNNETLTYTTSFRYDKFSRPKKIIKLLIDFDDAKKERNYHIYSIFELPK